MGKKFRRQSSHKKRPFGKREERNEEPAPVKTKKLRKEKVEALISDLSIGDNFEWKSSSSDDSFVKISCCAFIQKTPMQFRVTLDSRTKGKTEKYRTDIPFDDIQGIYVS